MENQTPAVSQIFKIIDVPPEFDECKYSDEVACRVFMKWLCSEDSNYGGWYQLTDAYND